MTPWLEGKRALIVGAGSGIGRAVVDSFLAEGSHVAVLERDKAKCDRLAIEMPHVCVLEGDATTASANRDAVAMTVETYGGLDILVNCVGVFDFYRRLETIDAEELDDAFDEMFATNVKSHLHSVKAAIPELQASRGNIVLTESTSAYYPGRGGTLYVASKFAIRGLVTTLAYELAPTVRVNGVAPGGTLGTDLRGLTALGLNEKRLDDNPGREADVSSRNPLKVALTGVDHSWGYVYLASDRARGISGSVVHTDGGMAVKV